MANIQITLLLPEEFLAEIDTYVKEQNLKRAPYIKELLFSAWQNRDVLAMSSGNNFAMSKDVENQESNRDVLPAIFDWLKNNGTRCEEVLSQININLEKLSATLIDNKSSKTLEIKQPTDLLTATPIEDTWEEENSQEDCAQYVDKDGNLLTPEEYQKAKEEHDKYMEEFELQRKLEKQAREVELRNQIKPMPHYTHLETYKDENSVIYQETYKQYQLRYNTIRTKNLQNTFELLNYMAPVLKTEKIYREFLEKIDAAESSNDKHLWQRAGGYNNYNLQKHLESLAAAQAQYPTYQKLNLPNFIPYTIQEETSRKVMPWEKEGAV